MPLSPLKAALGLLAVSLAAGLVPAPLHAAESPARPLPPGVYMATCRDIALNGETLEATCLRDDGTYGEARLDYAESCIGAISNINGHLACIAPTGNFYRTCRDVRIQGNTLYATCRRNDGTWSATSTIFRDNNHPISNCDGTLADRPTCDQARRPRTPAPPPPPNLHNVLQQEIGAVLNNMVP